MFREKNYSATKQMIKIKIGYINPSSSALEGFNIQRMVIHNKDISDGWWGKWTKLLCQPGW